MPRTSLPVPRVHGPADSVEMQAQAVVIRSTNALVQGGLDAAQGKARGVRSLA